MGNCTVTAVWQSGFLYMQTLAVGLVYSNKECVVGCMNYTVQSYNLKGRRSFAINLPAPILAMHGLTPPQQKVAKNLLVSLANGKAQPVACRYADLACVMLKPCFGVTQQPWLFGSCSNAVV